MQYLKHLVSVSLLTLSKPSCAAVVTAASTSFMAAMVAGGAGADPIPWAIGGFGAAVAYIKNPPTSRPDALANAGISIFLGGIGAPVAAQLAGKYVAPELANDYLMALGLSATWPRIMALAWPALQSFVSKKTESPNA